MSDLANAEDEKPTALHFADEVFYTDKELRKRWRCSAMKLWRLRATGKLHTVKIGGTGINLTPASNVRQLEAANAAASA